MGISTKLDELVDAIKAEYGIDEDGDPYYGEQHGDAQLNMNVIDPEDAEGDEAILVELDTDDANIQACLSLDAARAFRNALTAAIGLAEYRASKN